MEQVKKIDISEIFSKQKILNLLTLFLVCISCKSQTNTIVLDSEIVGKSDEIKVSSIIDSLKYSTEVGDFLYKCNFPKIKLEPRDKQKNINIIIGNKIQQDLPSFIFLGEDLDDLVTKNKTTQFLISETLKNLSKKDYSQGFYETYYKIYYNKKDFVSIGLKGNYCVGSCFLEGSKFTIDVKKETLVKSIFSHSTENLLQIINNKILKSIIETKKEFDNSDEKDKKYYLKQINQFLSDKSNYELDKLPENIFFVESKKLNREGLEFLYQPIIFEHYQERKLNPRPNLFFSFSELKPYLTNMFKERIEISM